MTSPTRMPRGPRVALLGMLAAAVVAPAGQAVAAPAAPVLIENLRCSPESLEFVLRATDTAARGADVAPTGIDRASLRAVASTGTDRVPLPVTARSVDSGAQATRLSVVVALDASQSLEPSELEAAKGAAVAFVRQLPIGTRVGLVRVGSTAEVVTPPTTDRARVLEAVDALERGGDTALYEAVVRSVQALGPEGMRSILLMTDGEDDVRGRVPWADLREAVDALRTSLVSVNAVSFGEDADRGALGTLVDVNGGDVLEVHEAGRLADTFTGVAASISTQVLVTARIPPEVRGALAGLTVTGTLAGRPFRLSPPDVCGARAPRPTAAATSPRRVDPPAPLGGVTTPAVLMIALGMIFVGSLAPTAAAADRLTRGQRREAKVMRRLSTYTLTGPIPKQTASQTHTSGALGDGVLTRSAVGLADKVIQRRGMEARLALRLEAAGVPLRPAEWLTVHTASCAVAGLSLLVISGGNPVLLFLGLLTGGVVPWLVLSTRTRRRKQAFQSALADMLQMLAGALRAGHSLSQALNALVAETRPPVSSEMRRAVLESQLGESLDDSLDRVAQRMECRDFEWVVMAIRIQRQVGGNLAELLTNVAGTLRERDRLRRQVRSLSAEGRMSAWILGLLPVALAAYLALARPDYLGVLFTVPIGWVMVMVATCLLLVGAVWLRKIIQVEV